jgi:putative membrane protein
MRSPFARDGAQKEEVGRDPDYRFTLANERTFLAWIRTALALTGAGLAAVQLLPPFAVRGGREVLGLLLVGLGTVVAATSYRRWSANQRAFRMDAPMPVTRLPAMLAAGVGAVCLVALLLLAAQALR